MANITGPEEGGSKTETSQRAGRFTRKEDPWEVLPQVVYDLSFILEGLLQQGPSATRIDLRMIRWKLTRAFKQLQLNETDLAQSLAEQDGESVDG